MWLDTYMSYSIRSQIISVATIKLRKALKEGRVSDPKNTAHEIIEGLTSEYPDAATYIDSLGWEGRSYEQMLGRIVNKAEGKW